MGVHLGAFFKLLLCLDLQLLIHTCTGAQGCG